MKRWIPTMNEFMKIGMVTIGTLFVANRVPAIRNIINQ